MPNPDGTIGRINEKELRLSTVAERAETRPGDEGRLYSLVGWAMLGGLLLSIVVMLVGLVLAATHGGVGTVHVVPLRQLPTAVQRGTASGLMDLGILILFAAPLLGVCVALVGFVREKDFAFASITALLVVMTIIGFVLAIR